MPLGIAYRNRAAAAGPSTGPYTLGLGLSVSETGLVGEPSGGNYSRQTVTLTTADNTHTITTAESFGAFSADLGAARAWGVYNNAGEFLFGHVLPQQVMLGSGATLSIPANSLSVEIA